jgi:phosphoribosylglycinamide formyltransferase, formyltetrahydrofolate-dependent
MKRLAVFVSGGGTDLQSVIDAIESGYIQNVEIALVVSSKAGVFALERAKKHKIPSTVFQKSNFLDKESLYEALATRLIAERVDYIVLAGYLSIIPKSFVDVFRDRIINIHPSLIPKYCGDGYYGIKVHEAVIAAGETESGATVHFVDEGIDSGKIIIQKR